MLGGCSQCAQSVALGGVSSLQLVNFISNGVIEKAIHITADKVDGCKASNLLSICLPKGTIERFTGMVCAFAFAQHFTEFNLLEVHCQQAFAFTAKVDRRASVR